jgi:hypothetical protein
MLISEPKIYLKKIWTPGKTAKFTSDFSADRLSWLEQRGMRNDDEIAPRVYDGWRSRYDLV